MMSVPGHRSTALFIAGVVVASSATALGWTATASAGPAPKFDPVVAQLKSGSLSGRVEFVPLDETVLIEASFTGLDPREQYSASIHEFVTAAGKGCEGVGRLLDPMDLSKSPAYRPDPADFATAAVGDLTAKFGRFEADRNGEFEFRGIDSTFSVNDLVGRRSFMLDGPDGATCATIERMPQG
ncbi:hypothetical protein [Nocardia aurea]|uniref:Uncharacterized protein n=2 Tax=Nocardiaceae TaxID=85025 RepID=A0ABV3G0E7_9NOCA